MNKYNLKIVFNNHALHISEAIFKQCKNVEEVRSFLNFSKNFINIGDMLINLQQVCFIEIESS